MASTEERSLAGAFHFHGSVATLGSRRGGALLSNLGVEVGVGFGLIGGQRGARIALNACLARNAERESADTERETGPEGIHGESVAPRGRGGQIRTVGERGRG